MKFKFNLLKIVKFKSIFNSSNFGDQSELIFFYHIWAKVTKRKILMLPIRFFDFKKKTFHFNEKGNIELFNCKSNYTINNSLLRKIFILYQYIIIFFTLIFYFFKKIFFILLKKNIFSEAIQDYKKGNRVHPNPLNIIYKSDLYFAYKDLLRNYKKLKSKDFLFDNFEYKLPDKIFEKCEF